MLFGVRVDLYCSYRWRFSRMSATYCFKAQVSMPTLKNHLSWLSKNPRYGLEVANEVARNAEQSGDDFLRYQIFYHPELSASGWSEIETYSGIRETQTQIRPTQKWSCGDGEEKYPLLFLIGIEVKSIESGTIYVAPRPGTYGAISLKNLQENSRPISMRSADRNTMICPDVSVAEVGSQHSCINIAAALTQSKTAASEPTRILKGFQGTWTDKKGICQANMEKGVANIYTIENDEITYWFYYSWASKKDQAYGSCGAEHGRTSSTGEVIVDLDCDHPGHSQKGVIFNQLNNNSVKTPFGILFRCQ